MLYENLYKLLTYTAIDLLSYFYVHRLYRKKVYDISCSFTSSKSVRECFIICGVNAWFFCLVLINDSDSIKIFQLFPVAMAKQDTKENISQDPQVFLPLIIRKQCWISIRILPNVIRVSETNSLDKSFTVFTH